ncbi:hypothetical protein FACS1894154_04890 [Betaproteobacteria bacterium]|nr:hypothetical protein FACS1894154_04890 [Betaproteobacteria bacterium]GHU24226.1 hypothetical protein FACS189488_08420 [Betaproteobacteria bacterium]
MKPFLSIEPNGALASELGDTLLAERKASWVLVMHSNSADIRIRLPLEHQGQHSLLVMPKRAENLFSLLADSVEEELELAFVLRGMPVDRAALEQLAGDLGIQPVLGMRPEDLSGGQKARLALAVLLLRKPATLVLDNSLAAIDEPSRNGVADLLHSAVETGMRLIELSTSAPFHTDYVTEALFEHDAVWICTDSGAMRERLLSQKDMDLAAVTVYPLSDRVVLQAQGLVFQYDRGFSLNVPEISVRAGEICWVVGPNGTGKTTLLKCLALLLRPHQGSLQITREDQSLNINFAIPSRVVDPVHRFVLYQFQEPDDQIYSETVYEEIVATARECHGIDEELMWAYSDQLGLTERLRCSPWDLSRSERRLLTLASILCASPAVALLDEPTVELDTRQKAAIAAALSTFTRAGGACIVISHDSSFMDAICSSCLDVCNGQVV